MQPTHIFAIFARKFAFFASKVLPTWKNAPPPQPNIVRRLWLMSQYSKLGSCIIFKETHVLWDQSNCGWDEMTFLQSEQEKRWQPYSTVALVRTPREVNWCWKIPCLSIRQICSGMQLGLKRFISDCWYELHVITHVHTSSQIWRRDLVVASDRAGCWIKLLLASLPELALLSIQRK